jgi:ABC-type spermidine/putrescine transport system permease subunit I
VRSPATADGLGVRFEIVGAAVPCLVFLLIAYALPVAQMLRLSVMDGGRFTLAHLGQTLDPLYVAVMLVTLKSSALVTLLCLGLGYPVAYLLTTSRPRVVTLIMLCVALPFSMSLLVRTYAWMILLGRQGVVNSLAQWGGLAAGPLPLLNNAFAVIVGMTQILLPFMIFSLYSGMKNIDLDLLKAAASLGAPPRQGFWRVFVPLSLPGIAAGGLLVFMLSIGFFIVPALLGGLRDVWMAQLIEVQINGVLDWPLAAALAVGLLVIVLAMYAVYERLLGVDTLALGSQR